VDTTSHLIQNEAVSMNVFIIGITGGVGSLLAGKLRTRGVLVHGLVRRDDQRAELATQGVNARVGDLASMSVHELATAVEDVDAVERDLGEEMEYYFTVKKGADIALTRSDQANVRER
jgi:putative NADH-flavin reductase